ncbi:MULTISPECIES: hypothetical protein [Desulfosediminicola]|uniref:hypothetical protein n=1 Tax=Desulfosediminicola TaxID=2886823 RepID=UPI0010AB9819|nr:hypothetical protein [Desulfosediminicola ganghwensis]
MDKRRYQRISVQGLSADISDGKGFFSGTVSDISQLGISLNHISRHLDRDAHILSVIVEGKGAHFKLLVTQKWESTNGEFKIIGTQIETSPWDWTDFVSQLEPEEDDVRS